MKAKIRTNASKLLNLYRQAHVIVGGWSAVNPIFVNETTDEIIQELQNMPTGNLLIQHIQNLRNGITPMNTINRELLPYGGMMADEVLSISLTNAQWREIEDAVNEFTPDEYGLNHFLSLDIVKRFGAEWPTALRAILSEKPYLKEKWDTVIQTYNAYRLWNTARDIIAAPISERVRAQVQVDMPEYETYLPMFGDAGTDLLEKLRTFISSMN
ncbi:MAG: hypothetical protein IKW67_02005 [Alphaproteobacteria bacterium]|nr:hypothetical protein [Alphaproteobacteria bacterium]